MGEPDVQEIKELREAFAIGLKESHIDGIGMGYDTDPSVPSSMAYDSGRKIGELLLEEKMSEDNLSNKQRHKQRRLLYEVFDAIRDVESTEVEKITTAIHLLIKLEKWWRKYGGKNDE